MRLFLSTCRIQGRLESFSALRLAFSRVFWLILFSLARLGTSLCSDSAAAGLRSLSGYPEQFPPTLVVLRKLTDGCKGAALVGMEPAEVEFLAEKELITVVPNFSENKLYLISVGGTLFTQLPALV